MMWHEPPKHTEPDHGQARMWSEPWQLGVRPSLPVVSVRVTVMRVSNVDTAQHTASCKVGVTLLWTDERLKGYDQFLLPGTLWGPELYLMNTVEVKREYEQFALVDPLKGVLKRVINYDAIIDCPMDLTTFPFDVTTVEVRFVTTSHWRTLDQSHHGSSPSTELYRLSTATRPHEGAALQVDVCNCWCSCCCYRRR